MARQIRVPKLDREVKRKTAALTSSTGRDSCKRAGARTEACAPFSEEELNQQLRRCSLKAPGPDGVCTEHLLHLGPRASTALLRLCNESWLRGEVPSEWRRATIVPIPKAVTNKSKVSSYRPITLISHLTKLIERLVLARLNHIVREKGLRSVSGRGAGRFPGETIGRGQHRPTHPDSPRWMEPPEVQTSRPRGGHLDAEVF